MIEQYIEKIAAYLPDFDKAKFQKAYQLAEKLFDGVYRYSGDSHLAHQFKIIDLLLPYKPDQATLLACFFVDCELAKDFNLAEIKDLFGQEVADIVNGMQKLDSIKSRRSKSNVNLMHKMFLTVAQDLRVMVIRLVERLQNMETLEFVSQNKQKGIAHETLDVYVPIAARLGLYKVKHRLEDLSLKYLFRDQYDSLLADMENYTDQFEKTIEQAKKELEDYMSQNNFEVTVLARVKNLYSIYNKLKKKNLSRVEDLYDIFALRIIVKNDLYNEAKDIEKLYAILSLLHVKYTPDLSRFKDYVVNPKPNGYQSLHTTVSGLASKNKEQFTEIQIRTESMHRIAENGYASHWLYKDKGKFDANFLFDNENKLVSGLQKIKNAMMEESAQIVLAPAKLDLYKDRIFVLTPDSQIKDLPKGATVLDFAYAVHTDIGHSFYLAKVNGAVVPLDYELQNSDMVEIITSNKPNPKLQWVSVVKTKLAKNRIKSYFKQLDSQKLYEDGKEDFNIFLERLNLPFLDENLTFFKVYLGKKLNYEERRVILEEIGSGVLPASAAFKNAKGVSAESVLFPHRRNDADKARMIPKKATGQVSLVKNSLVIGGERNMPYRISICCKPDLSTDIIAYVTKTKGISIHSKSCKFVKNADKSRLLSAHLENSDKSKIINYQVALLVEIQERSGYINEIVKLLILNDVRMLEFKVVKKDRDHVFRKMIVDVKNQAHLDGLIEQLGKIGGVLKVDRS